VHPLLAANVTTTSTVTATQTSTFESQVSLYIGTAAFIVDILILILIYYELFLSGLSL
jgi:hypothetical protein